jgi:uncharacterized protein
MKPIALALSCLLLLSVAAHADDTATFKGLMALAEKGDSEAQYHVGMFYNNGIGTTQDTKQAFAWFQKSAAKDPLGAYKLGCYYDGQGVGVVAQSEVEAQKYKRVAAEAGYSLAQYDVAAYEARQGNFDEAAKWIKKAADQGFDRALYGLSSLHNEGKGVPKDAVLALAYFELSVIVSEQYTDTNRARLDDLISRVTQAEQLKAQELVTTWKAQPTPLTIEAQNGVTAAEEHLKTAGP